MHLVQILLPLAGNDGKPFPESLLRSIQTELMERFGGVTAFSRAPAEGVWRHDGIRQRDDIVIVEVMTQVLDQAWWRQFRLKLEKCLRQDVVVIRAQALDLL